MKHPWSRALGCLVGLMLAAGIGTAESRIILHGDWLTGCDNMGRCAALGIPRAMAPGAGGVAIRIAGDGVVPGGFSVELIALSERVTIPAGLRLGPSAELALPWGGRRQLHAAQAAQWLDALRQGLPIAWHGTDAGRWSAPTAEGFADAWRALSSARLTLPVGAPHPATPQRLAPAHEVIPTGRTPVQAALFECPEGAGPEAWRRYGWAASPATLWALQCPGGRQHWHMQPWRDAPLMPLALPDGGEALIAAGRMGLANSAFEFDFGILRAWQHPQGRDDCGVQRAWAFDGSGWFLLERREMPLCAGLDPADWIATYSTR